jgi:hypothetical protein
MSHLTHSPVAPWYRTHTRLVVAALLALLATAAVVLVLAIGGDSSESVTANPATSQPVSEPQLRPDESAVGAAITGRTAAPQLRPDESAVGAAISGPR